MTRTLTFCLLLFSYFNVPGTLLANDREKFCEGFKEGYKAEKGDLVLVPMCPLPPITPLGSTPFREGIKAGQKAANRD